MMRASRNLNRLLSATVLTQQFLVSLNAQAGTATITTKDASGATLTWEVATTINATTFVGMSVLSDGSGNLLGTTGNPVMVSQVGSAVLTLATWTSGTLANSTATIMSVAQNGAPAVLVQLVQGTSISAGGVTFQCAYDAVPNWVTLPVAQAINPSTFAPLTNPYTLVANTNQPFLLLSQGCQQLRIVLTTAITGTGNVIPYVTLLPYNPTIGALLNPIAGTTAVNQAQVGGTAVVADPCVTSAKSYTSINLTSTAALVVATGTTGKLVYVCDFLVQPAVAANVALIEGTGGTCSGGTTAGVVGGTTAATGLNFAANGGLAQGNGAAAIWATHNTGNSLCILSSTTSQISGHMAYVLL